LLVTFWFLYLTKFSVSRKQDQAQLTIDWFTFILQHDAKTFL